MTPSTAVPAGTPRPSLPPNPMPAGPQPSGPQPSGPPTKAALSPLQPTVSGVRGSRVVPPAGAGSNQPGRYPAECLSPGYGGAAFRGAVPGSAGAVVAPGAGGNFPSGSTPGWRYGFGWPIPGTAEIAALILRETPRRSR